MIELVNLTEEDKAKGVPDDPRMCPVARAIRRAFGLKYEDVHVGQKIESPSMVFGSTDFPVGVREWITDYDNGRPVQPISFILDIDVDYW